MEEVKQEEFALVDLWAAEAYVTAVEAGEQELLEMLDQGIKIHQWLLDETTDKFGEEVQAAQYGYKSAKQGVHGMNYDVQPPKMAQESGLPLYVTQWQHNFYHTKFPGIKMRHHNILDQLNVDKCLTSLLGRKRTFVGLITEDVKKEAYAWPSQSVIGELTIIAMGKLFRRGLLKQPWVFPGLNTHDGLAIRCYKNQREEVKQVIMDGFSIPLRKGGNEIRIPVEIGWGDNFNDMVDVEVVRF